MRKESRGIKGLKQFQRFQELRERSLKGTTTLGVVPWDFPETTEGEEGLPLSPCGLCCYYAFADEEPTATDQTGEIQCLFK